MSENVSQSSIAKMAGDVIEHKSRPPPKKVIAPQAFPELQKMNFKPIPKARPVKPKEDIVQEMQDEESMPPPDEVLTDKALRYDLNGKNITGMQASTETYNKGLHNHGDSPEKPGYAVYELGLLCRSANIAQRALAFKTINNILNNMNSNVINDMKMVQIHKILINAFNPPTSATIKQYAGSIIMKLVTHFKNPLSLYPYPAIPMHSLFTTDFAPYIQDMCTMGEVDNRLYDAAAIAMVGAEKIDMKFMQSAKLSLPLLHFIRSAFINWGIVCGENFVAAGLNKKDDLEIQKEAAVIMRFHAKLPPMEQIKQLPPIVAVILLSRVEDPHTCEWLIDDAIKLCPDQFALEFLTNCAIHNLITKEQIEEVLKVSPFSQPAVALSEIVGKKPQLPVLPKSEEECWEKRGEVTGLVEYVLLHNDYTILPTLFKCLFSFTNPSADILTQHLFGVDAPQQRPLDPEYVFKVIEDCPAEKLPRIFEIGQYFPLHYTGRFFLRKDCLEQAQVFEKYLDNIPDPMKEKSIFECDIEQFIEKLMDGIEIPAFQKYALLCVTQFADIEVRHVIWDKLQGVASLFTVDYERKDHYEPYEDDLDTIHDVIDCLSSNEFKMTGILKVGFKIVHNLLKHYKGDVRGQLIMEHVLEMPTEWREKMLADLE